MTPKAWLTLVSLRACLVLAAAAGLCGLAGAARAADYTPTAAEVEAIHQLTEAYFVAVDGQDYAAAYAMQAPALQQMLGRSQWAELARKNHEQLGAMLMREPTAITWYLDPPDAPGPGLFVAVDLRSAYENADQHSEYLVWYRPTGASEFKLLRDEAKFNLRTAEDVGALAQSPPVAEPLPAEAPAPAEVVAPVELPAVAETPAPDASPAPPIEQLPIAEAPAPVEPSLAVDAPAPVEQPAPALDPPSNPIGFATVAEARRSLTMRTDVKLTKAASGWQLVGDPVDGSVWSFAPAGHPAYPAAVKRFVVMHGDQPEIRVQLLCESAAKACDKLRAEYEALSKPPAEAGKRKRR